MPGVVGLGGVFLKLEDPAGWRSWHARVLGVKFEDYGSAVFPHPRIGMTQIATFAADSDYFAPSISPFMINLIVDDIDAVLARAEAEAVKPEGRQDDEAFGRFAWLIDPAGIKVELWEPAAEGA